MVRKIRVSGLIGLVLSLPDMAGAQASASRSATGVTRQDFAVRLGRRISSADTDGDGRVSRAEFLAMAASGKGDPARRFARLDRNGDGVIDRPEIAAIAARRFGRLDTDGDGVLTPAERAAARAARDRGAPED